MLKSVLSYLDSCNKAIDLEHLRRLMSDVDVSLEELRPFVAFSDNGYQRNLVKQGAQYELLVLCWRSGQASRIHDHDGSSCCFKILQGEATETNFQLTGRTLDGEKLVKPIGSKPYQVGTVCASTSSHIHKISNETEGSLITLHCYSPALHMNTYLIDPIWAASAKPNHCMVASLKV